MNSGSSSSSCNNDDYKRKVIKVIKEISHEDVMYSTGNMVNNIAKTYMVTDGDQTYRGIFSNV